ncbi:MAG: EamA family transporter [Desulfotomaculaceae bacterium]|nr:EamA family transporter [Desulfotomaculaceae bacterium]
MLKKTAPFLVILAGCMWGAIGTFVRIMSAMGLDSTTIVECRIFGAMLMLVAGLLIYDKRLLKIKIKDIWIFIGAGLLCTAFFNTCYNIAINELTLSMAAILLCTAPFFVILLAKVFFGEKITSRKIKTLLLAFCGCVLVCGIFDHGATISVRGILIGILAGIDYAFLSIFARVAINKGYHTLTINTWSFICASLGLALFTNWGQLATLVTAAPLSMGGLLFLHALIGAAAPYILYTVALNYIDTGRAAILSCSEPVSATLLGYLLYHETLSLYALTGMMLVLAALIILSKPEAEEPARDVAA